MDWLTEVLTGLVVLLFVEYKHRKTVAEWRLRWMEALAEGARANERLDDLEEVRRLNMGL